jgi:hypothetical protein
LQLAARGAVSFTVLKKPHKGPRRLLHNQAAGVHSSSESSRGRYLIVWCSFLLSLTAFGSLSVYTECGIHSYFSVYERNMENSAQDVPRCCAVFKVAKRKRAGQARQS